MYCKIKTELGWQYPWEAHTQEAKLAPVKPVDALFNERWGKIAGAEKAVQNTPVIWTTKQMTFKEIQEENHKH